MAKRSDPNQLSLFPEPPAIDHDGRGMPIQDVARWCLAHSAGHNLKRRELGFLFRMTRLAVGARPTPEEGAKLSCIHKRVGKIVRFQRGE